MQSNNLPALKLRHRREEGLEEAADGVSKASDKPVQHELREVGGGSRMTLKYASNKRR